MASIKYKCKRVYFVLKALSSRQGILNVSCSRRGVRLTLRSFLYGRGVSFQYNSVEAMRLPVSSTVLFGSDLRCISVRARLSVLGQTITDLGGRKIVVIQSNSTSGGNR